jgi:hypothetical protein
MFLLGFIVFRQKTSNQRRFALPATIAAKYREPLCVLLFPVPFYAKTVSRTTDVNKFFIVKQKVDVAFGSELPATFPLPRSAPFAIAEQGFYCAWHRR